MTQLHPPLPRSALVVIAIMGGLIYMSGQEIARLRAVVDAKPLVEDFKVDDRTETVRRGPVTLKRHTETTAPDGTKKVVESTREIGPVETKLEAKTETGHKETPPLTAPKFKRRWGYLDFEPTKGYIPVGGRLGMDLVGDFGAGAWYYHPAKALGLTVGGRF